jgi:SAM-dependent methyltransferase
MRSLSMFRSQFSSIFLDPIKTINKYRALPYFVVNSFKYRQGNKNGRFPLRVRNIWYNSHDRFQKAGAATGHYFHQDLWAARIVYERGIKKLVDLGSRVDGFIAHILPYCEVCVVDVRPLRARIEGLSFIQATIEELPFENDSVPVLSCLHVLEHIGLGRYGDAVDPDGYLHAANEISRVLQQGGLLIFSIPVGRERLCFDSHRIFNPRTIIEAFSGLQLKKFSLIDDSGLGVITDATLEQGWNCDYGCGLFLFSK